MLMRNNALRRRPRERRGLQSMRPARRDRCGRSPSVKLLGFIEPEESLSHHARNEKSRPLASLRKYDKRFDMGEK